MPLCATAYLNMFSIRQRARSQHSNEAPVAVRSLVRACEIALPSSTKVSCRALP